MRREVDDTAIVRLVSFLTSHICRNVLAVARRESLVLPLSGRCHEMSRLKVRDELLRSAINRVSDSVRKTVRLGEFPSGFTISWSLRPNDEASLTRLWGKSLNSEDKSEGYASDGGVITGVEALLEEG